MRPTKTFVLFVLLSAFTTLISGQCGYPGRPLGGEVFDADTLEVVDWKDVLNGTVSYRCNIGYRLLSDDNERRCVNGVWTGSIPKCVHVETSEIEQIIDENGNTPYGLRLKVCYVSKVFPFSVKSPRKWWAIRLTASAPELQSVNWTVTSKTTGTKPMHRNLTIHRIEHENKFKALLVLNTGVKLAKLTLKADRDVSVCSAEIRSFPDQCGSPELPIDSEGEWNTSAVIYWCKKGLQLKSGDLNRQCVEGEWAGSVPVCTKMEITGSNEQSKLIPITPALSTITEDPWWPYLFFLALIPMAIGALFIFRKRSSFDSQQV